jgi:hypothetical protein
MPDPRGGAQHGGPGPTAQGVWQGIEQTVNDAVAPVEQAAKELRGGPAGAAKVAGNYLVANWLLGNPVGQAWLFGGFVWQQGQYAWTAATTRDPVERASSATKLTIDLGLYAASVLGARSLGTAPAGAGAANLRLVEPSLAAEVDAAIGTGGRGAARSGLGPVRQGVAGVERAIVDLEASDGRVLGREITLEAGGVRTRPDLFVQLPNGQQVFLEIKTGASARWTPNQAAAFPQIWTQGAIPRGANAAAAGLTPGVPIGPTPVWTVHYPWPLP